jgi:hypothetical protein
MTDLFRVRYREGDFEVEVESSDKNYVENKLKKLLEERNAYQTERPIRTKRKGSAKTPRKKQIAVDADDTTQVDIEAIVNLVNGYDDHATLAVNVLDKRDVLPKVLMCLYMVKDYDIEGLTSGQIAKVLDQLKSGGSQPTISRCLSTKGHQKYFSRSGVRTKGATVYYKLNRTGIAEFEKLLKGT